MVQRSLSNAAVSNALQRMLNTRPQQQRFPFVQSGAVFPAQQQMQNPMQNLSRADRFDLLTQSLAGLGAGFAKQGRPVVGARGINMLPGRGAAIEGMMGARQNFMDNLRKQQLAQAQMANMQSQMQGRQIKAAGDQLTLDIQRRLDEGIRKDPNFMNTPEGRALVNQINVGRRGSRPAVLQVADALKAASNAKNPGSMSDVQAINTALRTPPSYNLGNQILVRNPDGSTSALPIGIPPTQKIPYLKEKTQAVEKAKLSAKKIAGAPRTYANAERALNLIETMLQHPGIEGVGTSKGFAYGLPKTNAVRVGLLGLGGTPMEDFGGMHDNLKGIEFTGGIDSLRGLGAMSDKDAQAIKDSMNALKLTSSKKQYIAELNFIRARMQLARQNALRVLEGKPIQLTPDSEITELLKNKINARRTTEGRSPALFKTPTQDASTKKQIDKLMGP